MDILWKKACSHPVQKRNILLKSYRLFRNPTEIQVKYEKPYWNPIQKKKSCLTFYLCELFAEHLLGVLDSHVQSEPVAPFGSCIAWVGLVLEPDATARYKNGVR